MLRYTPLKRGNSTLKRGKIKAKKKTKEELEEKRLERDKMLMFFLRIWNKLEKKECWQCGKYLGQELLTIFFDHALEKSTRKDLKFEEENIFICCGDCHSSKTGGFPGDKHEEFIKKVREKFG